MYYSLYHIFLSALVGPALHNFVDACGRTPARTQPRPNSSPSPAPPQTASPTPRVTPAGARRHQEKCSPEEEKEAACLNGECYSIYLGGAHRNAFCKCPELYEGSRCEQLSDDFFVVYAGEVKKAGIAAGVVVAVIILTIIVVYCAIKRRKRRKREEERAAREQEAQLNGNATQPLMKEAVQPDSMAMNGMEKVPETNTPTTTTLNPAATTRVSEDSYSRGPAAGTRDHLCCRDPPPIENIHSYQHFYGTAIETPV
ncbi:hypothetical protein ACOMHN_030007 [Nucella lapillus]